MLGNVPTGKRVPLGTIWGNLIAYIEQGTVILQVEGKPDQTVKAGEAFTTSAGQVHNVKNASSTEPCKALAFYVAKKGAKMEDLSKPGEVMMFVRAGCPPAGQQRDIPLS